MWIITVIAALLAYEACEKNNFLDVTRWVLITGIGAVITVLSLLYGFYIVLK